MNTLRHYRLSAGFTQERLAEQAHISQGHLHKIETGQVMPWEREAQAIAIVFGVAPETLFPEGYKVRCDYGRMAVDPPDDPPPPPPRRYPRNDFVVMCWHCRTHVTMRADDREVSDFDVEPRCPACSAAFRDIVPLEEMTI